MVGQDQYPGVGWGQDTSGDPDNPAVVPPHQSESVLKNGVKTDPAEVLGVAEEVEEVEEVEEMTA